MNKINPNNDKYFNRLNDSTFSRFYNSTFFLITIHLSLLTVSLAQVNYEPVNNSVYSFLERMSNKGTIQLNEEIKPFSRIYIAKKIMSIKKQVSRKNNLEGTENTIQNPELKIKNEKFKIEKQNISGIEKEELEFYIREFAQELKNLGMDIQRYEVKEKLIDLKSDRFGFDKYNRFRLFSYENEDFGVFVDPILKYELNNYSDGSSWSYSNGIKLHGSLGDNVGFDLQFYDNHPRGSAIDRERKFSKRTGIGFDGLPKQNGFDFERMNANLSLSFDYVTLTLSKDFNYFGSGIDGKIILSNKAPSFPNIKLEVSPKSWLKFSYIHGLLDSRLLDSSTIRSNPQKDHILMVEKYFVSHILSITPFYFLNFSIGESVIYSDKFEPIYMVPIVFFRLADHYLGDPDVSSGNAQIFSSFWYKNFQLRTKFFGSVFIDELSTSSLNRPKAIGFNFGLKSIDPLIPESELVVEYTRINPFVYSHADSAQTYASYGYEMGHWIGSNADEIFLSFRKRILRGLNLDIWYRYIRKGNEEDIAEPRYQVDQTFLWGDVNKITIYGASINYELIHSFNINATYEYSESTGENDYLFNEGSVFQFSMSYGL